MTLKQDVKVIASVPSTMNSQQFTKNAVERLGQTRYVSQCYMSTCLVMGSNPTIYVGYNQSFSESRTTTVGNVCLLG